MKKTGAIIATILTSLFCGLPGLILAGIGILGLLPGGSPQAANAPQDTMLGGVLFIGGGVILILIPIIVGILSFRNKKAAGAATPVAVQGSAQTVMPVPSPVSQPQPTSPSPSPAGQPQPEQPLPSFLQPTDNSGDIRTRLMELNRPTAPYHIIDLPIVGHSYLEPCPIVSLEGG